jgi:hypothetical protein
VPVLETTTPRHDASEHTSRAREASLEDAGIVLSPDDAAALERLVENHALGRGLDNGNLLDGPGPIDPRRILKEGRELALVGTILMEAKEGWLDPTLAGLPRILDTIVQEARETVEREKDDPGELSEAAFRLQVARRTLAAVVRARGRRITIPAAIRPRVYQDALDDLGPVCDDLFGIASNLDSPEQRERLAELIGSFDSARSVLDALEWIPDGGDIDIEGVTVEALLTVLRGGRDSLIESIWSARKELDERPKDHTRVEHLRRVEAEFDSIASLLGELECPPLNLTDEQRAMLATIATRGYRIEGESIDGKAETLEAMRGLMARFGIFAALAELAEGTRDSLHGLDLALLDTMLAEFEKVCEETIDDDKNAIERTKTGDPGWRQQDSTVEQEVAKHEKLLAEDEAELVFVRWLRERVDAEGA